MGEGVLSGSEVVGCGKVGGVVVSVAAGDDSGVGRAKGALRLGGGMLRVRFGSGGSSSTRVERRPTTMTGTKLLLAGLVGFGVGPVGQIGDAIGGGIGEDVDDGPGVDVGGAGTPVVRGGKRYILHQLRGESTVGICVCK